ncbi:hypothetical protein HDE_08684 [Halotydeus destructor]|nr:hypothetical protein HDE_08684 [Halotydeus destructor]
MATEQRDNLAGKQLEEEVNDAGDCDEQRVQFMAQLNKLLNEGDTEVKKDGAQEPENGSGSVQDKSTRPDGGEKEDNSPETRREAL